MKMPMTEFHSHYSTQKNRIRMHHQSNLQQPPLIVRVLRLLLIILALTSSIDGLAYPGNVRADSSKTIFVHDTASGLNTGTSWTDAFTDFHSALDIAQSGDEIWVAGGTYRPSLQTDPADPRSATFKLIDGVKLYGGFVGSENSLDKRKWMENPTILSGDIDHNDLASPVTNVEQIQGDNAYHVVTSSGMGAGTLVDGLTITAGKTNILDDIYPCNGDQCGGGLWLNGGDLTLSNLIIQGNYAVVGGGIAIYSAGNVSMVKTTIQANVAYDGGGIKICSSHPPISQTTIAKNYAQGYGGGVAIHCNSRPVFTNITVYGNEGDWGGGMFIDAPLVSITHATFYNNTASDSFGNELLAAEGYDLSIQDSIFWNSSPGYSIGFGYGSGGLVATYNDILLPDGAVFPGEGNINADPRLSKLGDYGGLTQTFPLLPGSPAVDAVPLDKCTLADGISPMIVDQRGVTRPQGKGCDMGAYEAIFTSYFLPFMSR
jgi:hypothetical protein